VVLRSGDLVRIERQRFADYYELVEAPELQPRYPCGLSSSVHRSRTNASGTASRSCCARSLAASGADSVSARSPPCADRYGGPHRSTAAARSSLHCADPAPDRSVLLLMDPIYVFLMDPIYVFAGVACCSPSASA
jgi:hypothetical protein